MPEASITADAIVAFPGETEQQYQDTLNLISDIGFDQVNTAAYSPRPNTPAAVWSNQLSEEVKKARLQEINDVTDCMDYTITVSYTHLTLPTILRV